MDWTSRSWQQWLKATLEVISRLYILILVFIILRSHQLTNVWQCLGQNLCTTAAYRPVRELIQQERQKDIVWQLSSFTSLYCLVIFACSSLYCSSPSLLLITFNFCRIRSAELRKLRKLEWLHLQMKIRRIRWSPSDLWIWKTSKKPKIRLKEFLYLFVIHGC